LGPFVSLSLATLFAALALQNPTLDPETGVMKDVQPRISPPVVTPRPAPEVNSPSTTASPNMTAPPRLTPAPGDVSAPPGRTPLRRPNDAAPSSPTPAGQTPLPTPADTRTPAETYPLSFATESLELSQVLKTALDNNLDLRSSAFDVAISEKNIMAAIGVYDVFMTSGLYVSKAETPPRGSQILLSTAQKQIGGNIGFERKLESGGTMNLSIGASRGVTTQPINITNPAAGTADLATYLVSPSLTISHPLLRNAGLRVNRADIDRARLATTRAEAGEMLMAQTIVHDIILAYWDLLFASRDLENKRRAATTTAEQQRRTQAEVNAGRKSQLDLDTIYQSAVARENDVVLAENVLLDRSLTLRTLMGQEFIDRKVLGIIPMTDPQAISPAQVDLQAKIKQASEYHPQLKQLQISMASQRIDELVAANKRLPQLDTRFVASAQGRSIDAVPSADAGRPAVAGNWGTAFKNFFNKPETISGQGLMADYSVRLELNLQWDIQNRAPKATHERILIEMRRAEAQYRRTQQNISMSVIRAVNAQRTAAARMAITSEAVRLSQSNLRAEEARNRVGRSTSYDILFRQDELAIAEFNALNAQIDYLRATVELQTLTGELLPSYGLELASRAARISREGQEGADPTRYK
jgi:outer membrane protein